MRTLVTLVARSGDSLGRRRAQRTYRRRHEQFDAHICMAATTARQRSPAYPMALQQQAAL